MSLNTGNRSIIDLKYKAANFIKQTKETYRIVITTSDEEKKTVLQDPVSFEEIKNNLTLFKMMHQSEEAIRNGEVISNEDVFMELDLRLRNIREENKVHESEY
jgi:hypothetical protein